MPLTVYRRGDNLILRSKFDANRDLLQPLALARQNKPGGEVMTSFTNDTLTRVSLIPADAPETRVWSKPWLTLKATPIHNAADDICPIMLTDTGRYVGGNHGWHDEVSGADIHPATQGHTASANESDGALVVVESYEIARDGDLFGTVENTYRFTAEGTRVEQAFTAAKPTAINLGVTQAAALRFPRGGTLRQLMPGVPGWADPVDLATMTEQFNVTGEPPAHTAAQWAYDRQGKRLWGLELDVLSRPRGAAGRSWSLAFATKKNYPHVTWGTSLATGEAVSGVVSRRYVAA